MKNKTILIPVLIVTISLFGIMACSNISQESPRLATVASVNTPVTTTTVQPKKKRRTTYRTHKKRVRAKPIDAHTLSRRLKN